LCQERLEKEDKEDVKEKKTFFKMLKKTFFKMQKEDILQNAK
jgi:hypothetical protein